MTIKEALVTEIDTLPISDKKIEKALSDSKIIGTANYNFDTDGKNVDLVFAGLLLKMITPDEEREDDVSIKYPSEAKIQRIISGIYKKWHLPDPFAIKGPTVKQVKFW